MYLKIKRVEEAKEKSHTLYAAPLAVFSLGGL